MAADTTPNGHPLRLTKGEVAVIAQGWPPLLTVEQAADMIGVPKKTIYVWSSAGRLDLCARRRGKRLYILRDRFVKGFFDGAAW